jgi:hypothetical protein
MRKIILFLMMFIAYSGLTMAQTIENFEHVKMNIFSGGANGMISVIPNPDASGVNTSLYVAKMVRGMDGDPWAGWYGTLATPIDVTANKYVHVKVWKSRISPVVFKYERDGGNSGDVYSMTPQDSVNQWQELVFDMGKVVSGDYVKIVLIPDFESPLTLTEDITLYYDDLYANNDSLVGSAPVQMMEDFEVIPMNYMAGSEEDSSSLTVIDNPDKSGLNPSESVVEFKRDKDGVPWGGFWSALPTVIDVTDNKFVHVKVWKSRISPLHFKIQDGADGNSEIESMYPQTLTNAWEDIVFDFRAKTGTYPTISLMPDFEDPLTLTEDITLYFDDIVLNNDSTTMTPPVQIINVDMTDEGLTVGQQVFISGDFGGIYGTWVEPGNNPNNEMFDTDGDGTYTITMHLAEGVKPFKFFKGTTFSNGDNGPGDRTYAFSHYDSLTYKWGLKGLAVNKDDYTLIKDGHFNTDGTVVPTSVLAPAWGGWSGNGGTAEVIDGVCVMVPGAASDQWQLQVNQKGNDNDWMVYNDSSYVLQFDAWAAADRVFAIDFEDNAANQNNRFGLSSDPDAVSGKSEWAVKVTTTKTTYKRVVKFNTVKESTSFILNIMPSAAVDVVYIDNISLISLSDMHLFGLPVASIAVKGADNATTIATDMGTLQMNATISPADAHVKNFAWSVEAGTGTASIDGNGLLSALTNGTVTVFATSKDWVGKSGKKVITISGQTVGISDAAIKAVKVYPNPVTNELNVTLSAPNAKVAIYNSVGRMIEEVKVQGTQARFDVSSYASGVYFVKVNNESVVKFVK